MWDSTDLYSTSLTDEERDLGFELIELPAPQQRPYGHQANILAVAHRLSETDQIAKMDIPVIGGSSYRHERLRQVAGSNRTSVWMPVNSIVFPTAEMALASVGRLFQQAQLCH